MSEERLACVSEGGKDRSGRCVQCSSQGSLWYNKAVADPY